MRNFTSQSLTEFHIQCDIKTYRNLTQFLEENGIEKTIKCGNYFYPNEDKTEISTGFNISQKNASKVIEWLENNGFTQNP